MNIAILGGSGKQGSGLAMRWARAGHTTDLVSRDPARAAVHAAELSRKAGARIIARPTAEALADADVVVIAVPYAAQAATLGALGRSLDGKRVLDVVVPLDPAQLTRVWHPPGGSAALEAQAVLPRARVAAALHHVSSVHLANFDHALGDVLVCADDAAWLAEAIDLVAGLGCRALDAGALANSVALEGMTAVLLQLNKRYKWQAATLQIKGPGGP